MKTSQEILKASGIVPKLRLGSKLPKGGVKPLGKFHVRLISDKEVVGRDTQTGKEVPMVRYLLDLLMPDGKTWEKRIYQTRKINKETGEVSYLVQRFAELPENSHVVLEMRKIGIKNYVEVTEVGADGKEIVHDEEVIVEAE